MNGLEKGSWIVVLVFASLMSVVPLDPMILSFTMFGLFVVVSVILFQRMIRMNHWLDRVSPFAGVIVGLVAFMLYVGVFVFWVNQAPDSMWLRVMPQLVLVFIGVQLFVYTTASFLAGATRKRPSSFFRPLLIIAVIFYGALLLIPFQYNL